MKNLNVNQMEILNGGVSNRGCMLAGAAAAISAFIPGGGLLAGIGIFSAAALSDCF
ncbi:MAG: hypothetical protein HC854_14660 [Flavobacterium sp.]|nr:hypothetical protein [Flavobacterium sp.]